MSDPLYLASHNAHVDKNVTNPFTFGDLALDEAFTDRDDELRELVSDMRNGQNVLVYAPRRYGKSSLVLRAAQEAMRRKVLVGYCDLMTTPTKERLAAALAKTIYSDIASPVGQAFERAADSSAACASVRRSRSTRATARCASASRSVAAGPTSTTPSSGCSSYSASWPPSASGAW